MVVAEEEIRRKVAEMEEFKDDISIPRIKSEMTDIEAKNYIDEVIEEVKSSSESNK